MPLTEEYTAETGGIFKKSIFIQFSRMFDMKNIENIEVNRSSVLLKIRLSVFKLFHKESASL